MAASSIFLGYCYIPVLTSFFHATCIICIINVFHTVNLTLRTATSNHNIQKMDQKTTKNLEAKWELFKNIKTNDSCFKREKIERLLETPVKNENKGIKKKNVIDTPCENNIDTVAEEHFSLEYAYIFWHFCQFIMIK